MAVSSPIHSSNPFDILPIETNQHIASHIENDSDICNFRLICRSTLDAVDADNCSFWRRKFLSCFEKPVKTMSNFEFKRTYQKRRGVLKCGALFYLGDTKREKECLEVVRDLICGEFHSPISSRWKGDLTMTSQ